MEKTSRVAVALVIGCGLLAYRGIAEDKKAKGAADGPASVFQYVDMATAEMTDTQQRVLNKLKAEGTAAEVKVVRLRPGVFDRETLNLNFADGTSLEVKRARRTENPKSGFTWSGNLPAAADGNQLNTAHFAIQNDNNGTGSFTVKDFTYNLRPIGNGLHALIKRDPSKLKPEEPTEAIKKVQEEGAKKNKPATNPSAEAPSSYKVRVMVAYTSAVKENHPDVSAFIDSVFSITNVCYQTSSVPISLESAHVAEVSYTESGSVAQDVEHLSNTSDGIIDNIHTLRDLHKADIVVMLIDHADAYGMADAILADATTAFAVVDDEVADWYFTFAHEIGHLFGCRHNPEADPTASPFSYGHCYCNAAKQWRTIMSYDCTGHSQRVGIWSSPTLTYPSSGGDPAGTAATHDNCRVLRETAATIAGFRG